MAIPFRPLVAVPATRLGRRQGLLRVAAAAAVLLAGTVVATRPRPLQATRGELSTSPTVLAAPGRVQVRYTPMPGLQGESVLRLRGRVRDPQDGFRLTGTEVQALAELRRQRDGSYLGEFTFPDSTVVALLAVEDTSGSIIDSNSGRYWTVSMGRGDEPAADARQQYAYDQMESNWPHALQTLRDLALAVPEDPWRWAMLLASENATPELLSDLRRRFESFDADTDPARLSDPQYVSGMELLGALLAMESSDSALQGRALHWRRELINRHPGSEYGQDRQVIALMQQHGSNRAALAASLDSLYQRVAAPHRSRLLQAGLDAAVAIGRAEEADRWAVRWLEERPFEAPLVADRLITARISANGLERAMNLVMGELGGEADRRRDLHESRQAHAIAEHEFQVRMLSLGARAALLNGDSAQARAYASSALTLPQTFESATALDRLLAQHPMLADRAPLTALLALDPIRLRDDSTRPLVSGAAAAHAHDRREAIVAALRAELPVDSKGRTAQRADGTSRELAELLARERVLVMSFHPGCPYSRAAITELEKWRSRLREAGVEVVILTDASPAAIAKYRESGGKLATNDLWFDPTGSAHDVLRLVGTPMITSVSNGVQLTRPTSLMREAVRRALLLGGQ